MHVTYDYINLKINMEYRSVNGTWGYGEGNTGSVFVFGIATSTE